MTMWLPDDELVDLLIEAATAGLEPAAAAELAHRRDEVPGADREAIERAVVALTLAMRPAEEPLPQSLRARLVGRAAAAVPRVAAIPRRAPRLPAGSAGWFAAAAALLLAVVGWYPRLVPPRPAANPAADRSFFVAHTQGLVALPFTATGDAAGPAASGDVVWDPRSQHGYMRFRGLAPNDVRRFQYQLWIFDAERDERYPVDGGVFDIPAGSAEVVVPVTARLHVGKPVLFAVTIERPGGVVVSGRERIAVLAKPART